MFGGLLGLTFRKRGRMGQVSHLGVLTVRCPRAWRVLLAGLTLCMKLNTWFLLPQRAMWWSDSNIQAAATASALGVDLIGSDGAVSYKSYNEVNVGSRYQSTPYNYTLSSVAEGTYILRIIVCHESKDNNLANTRGNITVTGADEVTTASGIYTTLQVPLLTYLIRMSVLILPLFKRRSPTQLLHTMQHRQTQTLPLCKTHTERVKADQITAPS